MTTVTPRGTLRIAALLTCHNRRAKTLKCLESLTAQQNVEPIADIFLVDDGSTDGTGAAVREAFPHTWIIDGDGTLFWAGGMRRAFAQAIEKGDFDAYLWLNDDVELAPDALCRLIETWEESKSRDASAAIFCGSLRDPTTGKHSYGGVVRHSRIRSLAFLPVYPQELPRRCDTMNGNLVLIDSAVPTRIGNLSSCFTHTIADFDYGLRATSAGFSCRVAPGYFGTCMRNPLAGAWMDRKHSLKERLSLRASHRGLPLLEWAIFAKRHAGAHWPVFLLSIQFRVLFPGLHSAIISALFGQRDGEGRNR